MNYFDIKLIIYLQHIEPATVRDYYQCSQKDATTGDWFQRTVWTTKSRGTKNENT